MKISDIQKNIFKNPFTLNDIDDLYKIFTITKEFEIYEVDKNSDVDIASYLILKDSIDVLELIEIGTLKESRNKGYGYRLLEDCLKKVDKEVLLEVSEKNEIAIKLYQKLGFEKISVRKNYYGNNISANIMKYAPKQKN